MGCWRVTPGMVEKDVASCKRWRIAPLVSCSYVSLISFVFKQTIFWLHNSSSFCFSFILQFLLYALFLLSLEIFLFSLSRRDWLQFLFMHTLSSGSEGYVVSEYDTTLLRFNNLFPLILFDRKKENTCSIFSNYF